MKSKKIPYVKLTSEENSKPSKLIDINQARVGAMIYFIIGLIVGIIIKW